VDVSPRRDRSPGLAELVSARSIATVWAPIAAITALHYGTSEHVHWLHDVLRRLYYLPILLAAFSLGLRGALLASLAASIAYGPHGFLLFTHHDPAREVEKALEVLLYNVVAVVAGVLADRERRERRRQEETAARLARSLAEKEEMERLLVRAGRLQAMGELTAGLAHEIKNPLASIQGAAEAIADEIPETSPRRRMAAILLQELARLSALLDRFLSFARPETYDLSAVSLSAVVESVRDLVAAQAGQGGVRIAWTPPAADVVVRGERGKVVQVLMNLVLNAIQAMPGGGVVRIACGQRRRGGHDYGALTVEDEGPGVPEPIREKIFNPFFTTKEKGLGLGLAIAERIVDQHGGFLDVENRAEGGARFTLLLPINADPSRDV
jgi:signal transduction histidine kinase